MTKLKIVSNFSRLGKRSKSRNGPVPSILDGMPDPPEEKVELLPKEPPEMPTNQETIDESKVWMSLVGALVAPDLKNARDFILNDLLPRSIALRAGTEEALEIARLGLGEKPESQALISTLSSLSTLAIRVKIVSYLMRHFDLSETESRVFRLADFHLQTGNTHGVDITTLLREVLQLSGGVQRPKEVDGDRSQLRPIHPIEKHRPRRRIRRAELDPDE